MFKELETSTSKIKELKQKIQDKSLDILADPVSQLRSAKKITEKLLEINEGDLVLREDV